MRVPRIAEQGPVGGSVQAHTVQPYQPEGLKQVQQTAQALGAMGKGLSRLGEAVQLENDEAKTQHAFNLYEEWSRAHLNPKSGYLSQLGESAVNGYEGAVEEVEAKRREFSEGLQNPRQRELYDRVSRARKRESLGRLDSHAANQARAFNIGTKMASLQAMSEEYMTLVVDPNSVTSPLEEQDTINRRNALLARMHQTSTDLYELQTGAGPDSKINKQMSVVLEGRLHEGALTKLIESKNIVGADEYLEKYGDKIPTKARVTLTKNLDTLQMVQGARDRTVDWFNEITNQNIDLLGHDVKVPDDKSPAQVQYELATQVEEYIANNDVSTEEAAALRAETTKLSTRNNNMVAMESNAAVAQATQELAGMPPGTSVMELSNYADLKRLDLADALQAKIDTANKVVTPFATWQAWTNLVAGGKDGKVTFFPGTSRAATYDSLRGMTQEEFTALSVDMGIEDRKKFYLKVKDANKGGAWGKWSPADAAAKLQESKVNTAVQILLGQVDTRGKNLNKKEWLRYEEREMRLEILLRTELETRGIDDDYKSPGWEDRWDEEIADIIADAAFVNINTVTKDPQYLEGEITKKLADDLEISLDELQNLQYFDEVPLPDGSTIQQFWTKIPPAVRGELRSQLKADEQPYEMRDVVEAWAEEQPMTVDEAKMTTTQLRVMRNQKIVDKLQKAAASLDKAQRGFGGLNTQNVEDIIVSDDTTAYPRDPRERSTPGYEFQEQTWEVLQRRPELRRMLPGIKAKAKARREKKAPK